MFFLIDQDSSGAAAYHEELFFYVCNVFVLNLNAEKGYSAKLLPPVKGINIITLTPNPEKDDKNYQNIHYFCHTLGMALDLTVL